MALGTEPPHGFAEALRLARRLLSANTDLVRKGVVDTEAEQLVIAAFRRAGGKELTRAELYLRAGDLYPGAAGEQLIIYAAARAEGRLLQHLIGTQRFLEHEYEVGPDVLVPRPETELLAALAMEKLREPKVGLEIGLGSGVLSIELLARFPALEMIATELSRPAIDRARTNAQRLLGRTASRLRVLEAGSPLEVCEPFLRAGAHGAQFLISNPPYLASHAETDAEVLAHEPHEALFAPKEDSLHFYRKIAIDAPKLLAPGAQVFLELPHERAGEIRTLFEDWNDPVLLRDLTGRERMLTARWTK